MPFIPLVSPQSQLFSKSLSVQIRGNLRVNIWRPVVLPSTSTLPYPSTDEGYTGDSDPFCAERKNKAGLAGRSYETAKEERTMVARPPGPAQPPFSTPEGGTSPTQPLQEFGPNTR